MQILGAGSIETMKMLEHTASPHGARKVRSLDRHTRNVIDPTSPTAQRTAVSVESISYHGWPDCYRLSNGIVEATVVPAIGRVMQLRLEGEAEGVFWENRELDGQLHDDASNEWINFGGDKCWPAPQAVWTGQQGRAWPPPAAFDARPVKATPIERGVLVTSPIDPGFGIQVVRRIEVEAGQPVLRIHTEYRKLKGRAVRVGVWTITQMRDPERVAILLPERSKHPAGYLRLLASEPEQLKLTSRLLSLQRHPRLYVKLGSDGGSMAWVGARCALRIDAETGAGEYPDGGCATEIYTNPDPLPYVELETLGPLTSLSVGERIARGTSYTVLPRSTPEPEAELRHIFGL
jgi:hypothetical protein